MQTHTASGYLVGIPTKTWAVRSCRRIKFSGSKGICEELRRQKQDSNCYVHEIATARGRALHGALRVTPATFCDWVVLAWISRNCCIALRERMFGDIKC
jgi:hypothetical protein